MADIAIGNPVSPLAQLAPLGLFPGFHIAQSNYQVIGNCGLNSLMQCSNGLVQGPHMVTGLDCWNHSRDCRLARRTI